MSSLKTLCVVIVLGAVGYGAYVTLTGRPPNDPPADAATDWEKGPQVEMPEGLAAGRTAPPAAAAAAPATPAPSPPSPSPAATIGSPPADIALAAPPASTGPSAAPPFNAPTIGPPANADPNSTPPGMPALGAPQNAADAAAPLAKLSAGGIDTVPPAEPDTHSEFVAAMQSTQTLLDQNRLADSLLALSEWYANPRLPPADQQQLTDLLDQLAGTVVYSRQHLLEPSYTVQPGDTLERIAERYDVPWQLLAKINGVPDSRYLRPGDQLKVLRGPFDASVNLTNYELTLMLRGRYAGRFKVGIGQDHSTPEGEFVVKNKVTNPAYPGPPPVAADDPANPLGERWIDLGNQIGIHGTNDPASIGRAESRGCIRLSPTDVEDVYDILSIGSKVVIRR
ncbi:MAG TPA: L,D-transpeptidase family protein [Pirellulales bacterium]|nr:L,D-transpeptidase family protein [Pirellulales bacterium]